MTSAVRENDNTIRLPIAKVMFSMDLPVYTKSNNKIIKVADTYVQRGQDHPVYRFLSDNVIELVDQTIVIIESKSQLLKMSSGKLFNIKDNINVFSKRGVLTRTLQKGQVTNVRKVQKVNGLLIYELNDQEVVPKQEGLEFVMGIYKPKNEQIIQYSNNQIVLLPNRSYTFSDVDATKIRLNSFENLYIDVLYCKGELDTCYMNNK